MISVSEQTLEKFKKLIPYIWLAKGTKQSSDAIIDMLVSEKLAELEKKEDKKAKKPGKGMLAAMQEAVKKVQEEEERRLQEEEEKIRLVTWELSWPLYLYLMRQPSRS